MAKFEIGDRVIITAHKYIPDHESIGKRGVIISRAPEDGWVVKTASGRVYPKLESSIKLVRQR